MQKGDSYRSFAESSDGVGTLRIAEILKPLLFWRYASHGVSVPGLIVGAATGMVTVLLAARSPAKQASKVSPLTAVSGNAGTTNAATKAANTRFYHVETAFGVHHALGSKKIFLLMA